MKHIGIIGAMDEEVSQLKATMSDIIEETFASMTFCKGKLEGKDVIVVRSGICKVNMAACVQILVDKYDVGAIINTGIAGSLSNDINIGDLVVSNEAVQHDVDATAFGYKLGVIPRMETSVFPADKELVQLAVDCCKRVNTDISVFTGRIVSGDQFISSDEKKLQLSQDFSGYCTEMEGAAAAQVAYLNQVPFVIIRAISDKADNSAQMNYDEFEELAIKHTVGLMKEMIKQYNC